jgi:hypothetical protein
MASVTDKTNSQLPAAGNQGAEIGSQETTADNQTPILEGSAAQNNAARTTNNAQQIASTTVTKSSSVRNNDRGSETASVAATNIDTQKPMTDNTQQTVSNNLPEVTQTVAANTVQETGKPEILDGPSVGADTKSNYAAEALMTSKAGTPDLMDDGEKSRKGPFRGLVRKASRFLNKAANPDPDKATVRVASFEIALGR